MGTTRGSDGDTGTGDDAGSGPSNGANAGAGAGSGQPALPRRAPRVRFGESNANGLNQERVAQLRDEFVAATQELARVQARQMRALAEIQELALALECEPAETSVMLRSLAAECAVPARMSERAVLNLMGSAHALCYLFPLSFAALEQAAVSMPHVRVIVEEAAALSMELRPQYEERCLDEAAGTTPARLSPRARAIAEELQPRTVDERHQAAAAARTVWVRDLPDGMAELGAILPAVLAYGVKDRIDRIAKAAKSRVTRESNAQRKAEAAAQAQAEAQSDTQAQAGAQAGSLAETPTDAQFSAPTLADSEASLPAAESSAVAPTDAGGAEAASCEPTNSETANSQSACDEAACSEAKQRDAASGQAEVTLDPRTKLPTNYPFLTPEKQQVARAEAQRLKDAEAIWSLDTFRADAFAEILLTGIPRSGVTADDAMPAGGTTGLTGERAATGSAGSVRSADRAGSAGTTGSASTTRAYPSPVRRATVTSEVAPEIQAQISIIIPVGGTATLQGYGPIDTDTARRFAAATPGWDYTIIEIDGTVLATERRHPTEAMKRILRARDQHCRFPGCFVPVGSCEIDHTIEWAQGGKTEICNLAYLCPKHHLLKHADLSDEVRWRVDQDAGGNLFWGSPVGDAYVDVPERPYRTKSTVTKTATTAAAPGTESASESKTGKTEEEAFGPGFDD